MAFPSLKLLILLFLIPPCFTYSPQDYGDAAVMAHVIGNGPLNLNYYLRSLSVSCEARSPSLWRVAERDYLACRKLKQSRISKSLTGSLRDMCESWVAESSCNQNLARDLDQCLGQRRGSKALEFMDAYTEFICRDLHDTSSQLEPRDPVGVFKCFPQLQDRILTCAKRSARAIGDANGHCGDLSKVSNCFAEFYTEDCSNAGVLSYMKDFHRYLSHRLRCPYQEEIWSRLNDKRGFLSFRMNKEERLNYHSLPTPETRARVELPMPRSSSSSITTKPRIFDEDDKELEITFWKPIPLSSPLPSPVSPIASPQLELELEPSYAHPKQEPGRKYSADFNLPLTSRKLEKQILPQFFHVQPTPTSIPLSPTPRPIPLHVFRPGNGLSPKSWAWAFVNYAHDRSRNGEESESDKEILQRTEGNFGTYDLYGIQHPAIFPRPRPRNLSDRRRLRKGKTLFSEESEEMDRTLEDKNHLRKHKDEHTFEVQTESTPLTPIFENYDYGPGINYFSKKRNTATPQVVQPDEAFEHKSKSTAFTKNMRYNVPKNASRNYHSRRPQQTPKSAEISKPTTLTPTAPPPTMTEFPEKYSNNRIVFPTRRHFLISPEAVRKSFQPTEPQVEAVTTIPEEQDITTSTPPSAPKRRKIKVRKRPLNGTALATPSGIVMKIDRPRNSTFSTFN